MKFFVVHNKEAASQSRTGYPAASMLQLRTALDSGHQIELAGKLAAIGHSIRQQQTFVRGRI